MDTTDDQDAETYELLLKLKELRCARLQAVLETFGIAHVDYLSLDVEGAELLDRHYLILSLMCVGLVLILAFALLWRVLATEAEP